MYEDSSELGKLIFIHGASSSGKSTLIKELQAIIEEPFWHYSIDHFRDSEILPMERFANGDFVWSEYRERFFNGYHNSIQSFLRSGNNLILEYIIENKNWRRLLQKLFEGIDVFFVGVLCGLDELGRKEKCFLFS